MRETKETKKTYEETKEIHEIKGNKKIIYEK
jgi:hypothetical protein